MWLRKRQLLQGKRSLISFETLQNVVDMSGRQLGIEAVWGAQASNAKEGMNSGQAQCFPQSFLRTELGFGFPGCVCLFPSFQGLQKCWECGCPVEGAGLSRQSLAQHSSVCPVGPARPPRWLLSCRAVWFALWVKFLANYCSFLLRFHQRMGRGLPAVCGQDFWTRAQIWGGCCLVNTRLALPCCSASFT